MIYFIQDSLTFRIKIGFSGKDDPKERLTALQTGNSSLLFLLATRPGTKQTEDDLHAEFKGCRTQGEWFDPHPLLIQYIIGCSAVEMARIATVVAVDDLVARSFPETKAELARRQAVTLLAHYRSSGFRLWLCDGEIKVQRKSGFINEKELDQLPKNRVHVYLLLKAEAEEGKAEVPFPLPPPPPPQESSLRRLWTEVLQSLPPLMVSQLEKGGFPVQTTTDTLTLTFPRRYAGEKDYCMEPTRWARIEAVLSKFAGKSMRVRVLDEILVGMDVKHARYGLGKVLEVGGEGALQKLRVQFGEGGERTFLAINAEFQVVNDPR